ncbi:hypothetical protein [Dyella caseinilytica]|uniref:Uncharacterized protein n=1 Tax=Dyella caseinilytica TaxID=1849581 RepID=A0ABX7GZL9_9GAMM|nr:hypothetical protein [Dyella caseinilytica]QRN55092.1 hypothetical protein ISN74_07065 [Dyella caseinilytica]GFZ99321.1 hypothetical protein GCM10011408_19990 [Dyella caseinilytica]
MNGHRLANALLAMFLLATSAHATSSRGAIHFYGSVYLPASASRMLSAKTRADTVDATSSVSLTDAQKALHSDLLEYFAHYSGANAKLFSVTYL